MTISTILPLLESFTQSSKTRDQDDNDKCALIELFEKSTDFSRTLSAGAEQKIVELLLRQKTAGVRSTLLPVLALELSPGPLSWMSSSPIPSSAAASPPLLIGHSRY
jgi:hypothetical protein